jgi:4-amino-4-deoxy-L-arabinose transferase-like glycosyltransferase
LKPALAALLAVLWLALLPLRPLFNPDEGRYAEIPREMLASGDWVIPHLNGLAYIEKPPLQYWATAATFAVFGIGEFTARLYTALCALGTLAVVGFTARRLWGADAAWRAVAVLGSMLLFVVLGQLLTLDMGLTFYMTLALAAFLLAQASDARWMLVAWASTALGVLSKGLVAAAVPAAVLLLYSGLSRDLTPWRRLQAAVGLPLFLAIAVPWHWLAAVRLPQFLKFFFVHEHLDRYLTPSADREEAWWFFGAVIALGCLPWTGSVLRVLATGWRRRAPGGEVPQLLFDVRQFLWVWAVFVVVFFSLSDSKLIPYVLPALPALALMVAASPAATLRREFWLAAAGTLLAGTALAAAGVLGPRYLGGSERDRVFALLAQPLLEIGVLLGLVGVWAWVRRDPDATHSAMLLGWGWCLAGLLVMRAAALVAPIYSGAGLARAAVPPAGAALYSVGTYDQTLPFYWRRTVTLAAYRGELDFGLRLDPARGIPTVADFLDTWRRAPSAYAVMDLSLYKDLERQGVPMREIDHDLRHVLVARP